MTFYQCRNSFIYHYFLFLIITSIWIAQPQFLSVVEIDILPQTPLRIYSLYFHPLLHFLFQVVARLLFMVVVTKSAFYQRYELDKHQILI